MGNSNSVKYWRSRHHGKETITPKSDDNVVSSTSREQPQPAGSDTACTSGGHCGAGEPYIPSVCFYCLKIFEN